MGLFCKIRREIRTVFSKKNQSIGKTTYYDLYKCQHRKSLIATHKQDITRFERVPRNSIGRNPKLEKFTREGRR